MAVGDDWDETKPADSDNISAGASEIRELKVATRKRIEREHEDLGASDTGGEHLEGSARAYVNTTGTQPTLRPDGVTSIGSDDEGRLYIDDSTDKRYLYFVDASGNWQGTRLKPPSKGTHATENGVCVVACGQYTGDGTDNRVITAFPTIVTLVRVTVRIGNSKCIEGMYADGTSKTWRPEEPYPEVSELVLPGDNTFKVSGDKAGLPNENGEVFFWTAFGIFGAQGT